MDDFEDIEITPKQVKARLDRGERFLLVDVREPWEHQTAHIEGAVLIPLRQIPENIGRFSEGADVVFFCHHGMRSLDAAHWVRAQGISTVRSMAGGIERWSTEIDPGVPRY